jgi:DNA polymerase III sliding clamp (beta) subunit (PCNA family)
MARRSTACSPIDYYKGVTLQVTDGKIIAFASNGRRMVRTASPTEAEDAAPIVIYRPSIDEIVRLCGKGGGQFAWTPRLLSVRTGDCTFTTKLLDTTPPPFDKYVAEKVPAVEPFIEIDREALASAINRLEIVASQARVMSFEWKANPRELRLSVAGNGEGAETIECVGAKMKAGYFGVAISDVLGVLNAMKAETIRLAPVANTQPFRVIDPTDSEFVAVLAPCRAGADVIARHAA